MPPRKQITIKAGPDSNHMYFNSVPTRGTLIAEQQEEDTSDEEYGRGNYPIAGSEYIIGGYQDHRIAGNLQPRVRNAYYYPETMQTGSKKRKDEYAVEGSGFFDDIVTPIYSISKAILGGAVPWEKIGEKLGNAVGYITIKALGGGLSKVEHDAMLLGRIERIEAALGLPEYTDKMQKSFLSHVTKGKKKVKGGELAAPELLGRDPVSKPPRQSRLKATDLL